MSTVVLHLKGYQQGWKNGLGFLDAFSLSHSISLMKWSIVPFPSLVVICNYKALYLRGGSLAPGIKVTEILQFRMTLSQAERQLKPRINSNLIHSLHSAIDASN